MVNRMRTAILLPVFSLALPGCGSSFSGPLAPSGVPHVAPAIPGVPPVAPPIQLAVFTDPALGFSVSDVRDAQDRIVRFNTAGELIWMADGTRFSGYRVLGDQIRGPGLDDWFQVVFGKKDGEQRAYLGWSDEWCHCPGYPATMINIEVVNGRLVFTPTKILVPGR